MAEGLIIQIGAETKDLQKELRKAKKDLADFEKKVKGGSDGFDKLSKSSANAVPSVQEFSRVIQDAPFGIQGVANNITQLTAQFGNLSKKAGGTGAALKAMLGTLSGPAGVLLVVSAVTSLLVSFGDELFKTGNKADELKKKQDALKQSLDDYVNGLETVAQARLKGEQSAQKELRTLEQLRKQAENVNLSQSSRLAAVKKLQSEYPSYLGNLSQEKILNGGLDTTYKNLTNSILARARATAASNKIVKNSETLLTLEDKLAGLVAKSKDLKTKADLQSAKAVEATTTLQKGNNTVISKANQLNSEYADTLEEINNLQGQIQSLELANIDLEGLVGDTPAIEEGKRIGKNIKRGISEELSVQTAGGTFNTLSFGDTDGSTIAAGLQADLDAASLARGQFLANQLAFEEAYKASLARINEETNLKTSLVSSAFTNLGQNIANALGQTQGIFGAFVGTIIQESLKLVQQLIISSIKGAAATKAAAAGQIAAAQGAASALAVQAAAATAAASGPGAAFILPGLIAGALAAISSAFSGIGGGGGVSGGAGGSGSVNNSSAVNTSFGGGLGSGNQRVVFQISGRNLLGVLQNEIGAANRINGQNIENISLG